MLAQMPRFQRDFASLLLRWALAAIFVVYGAVKVVQTAPLQREITLPVQTLVGWGELLGGLALAVGLLSRFAAVELIVIQVGAILLVTGKHALEISPMGKTGVDYRKVGPEYNLILITMLLCVIILGSGVVSVDHLLLTCWRKMRNRSRSASVSVPTTSGEGVVAGVVK